MPGGSGEAPPGGSGAGGRLLTPRAHQALRAPYLGSLFNPWPLLEAVAVAAAVPQSALLPLLLAIAAGLDTRVQHRLRGLASPPQAALQATTGHSGTLSN
ncbi:hypothetical protein NDU88_000571 [Pleurodeles waltl]|uniref:Uncharacterized protein n=1 Tax=Pleurodeles waltl TaxID=8319 RepID=A0AAV7THK9_PLEWA|nr:hypothetical protein NDU88_000571 [Pleurodeles waltl]